MSDGWNATADGAIMKASQDGERMTMTFGEKLQRQRREKGLSQDRLAELLGVSRQAVSKWERDEALPETDKVIRLSEIFSVSIDYLLKDRPEPEEKTQPPRAPDFLSQVGGWFKSKGWYLGYAAVAWGVWDFMRVLFARMAYGAMTDYVGSIPGFADADIGGVLNAPMATLWLVVILGAVKLAGGILIVILGRRYSRRRSGEKEEKI